MKKIIFFVFSYILNLNICYSQNIGYTSTQYDGLQLTDKARSFYQKDFDRLMKEFKKDCEKESGKNIIFFYFLMCHKLNSRHDNPYLTKMLKEEREKIMCQLENELSLHKFNEEWLYILHSYYYIRIRSAEHETIYYEDFIEEHYEFSIYNIDKLKFDNAILEEGVKYEAVFENGELKFLNKC